MFRVLWLVAMASALALTVSGCGGGVESAPANQLPDIRALTVNPDVMARGGIAVAQVSAMDPDGDALAYSWSADQGFTVAADAEETHNETAVVKPTKGRRLPGVRLWWTG